MPSVLKRSGSGKDDKMKRKLFCVFCVLLCQMSTLTVNAAEEQFYQCNNNSVTTNSVYRYEVIGNHIPTLSITNHNALLNIKVSIPSGYYYEIETTLYRSTNKKDWIAANRWIKSGSSGIQQPFSYSYSVASNLYYKITDIVRVYNSDDSLLEDDEKNSAIVQCK